MVTKAEIEAKDKREEELRLWEKEDVTITRDGTKIILPAIPREMSLDAAIKAIERRIRDENTQMDVHEVIDAYPMDAAVAFVKAMRRKYGWASPVPKMTFFGPMPPDLLTVKIGPGPKDTIQVPWGQFTIPGVENQIGLSVTHTKNGMAFVIYGQVKKGEQHVLKELAELTREILKTESIYKGKAIQLSSDVDGDIDQNQHPEFIEVDRIAIRNLVLNQIERDQVQCSLWAPIENTALCEQHKIPLKRGILLEGTFGTGKTMTAQATAKVCVDNGWTFILLDDVRGLAEALRFAKRYQPSVVFAEDVDRVVAERDDRGNDLLNTIDGVVGKNAKVITVLTTNHVEVLNQAMLRPGRLDAVISIRPPEAESVKALLRIYGRELLSDEEKLDKVGEILAGNIPATIREVMERSKLAMIHHGRDVVTEEDLVIAAEGMTRHLELLAGRPAEPSAAEKMAEGLRDVILPNADTLKKLSTVSADLKRFDNRMKAMTGAITNSMDLSAEATTKGAMKVSGDVKKVEGKVDDVAETVEEIKEIVE